MSRIPVLAGDDAGINAAVRALQDGGLVGLPTETVYGLAADAEQPDAVARIYAAKGRPVGHPLIVHISGPEVLDQWALDIPDHARLLTEHLWPGPLTIVLRRSGRVGDHITGGQDTVALRSPSHPVAREVISRFMGGVAAPSANRFGRVSPTTVAHVVDELDEILHPLTDLILDGGPCQVGLESTIVDCTGAAPRILRPGGIDHLDLSRASGVAVTPFAPEVTTGQDVPRVSGTLESHYSPEAHVVLATPMSIESAIQASEGPHGLIALDQIATPVDMVRLIAPGSLQEYAGSLYAALRTADELNLRTVIAVPPTRDLNHGGLGAAIVDRLTRAAFSSH
jgi:L-threonylcarbamoyladenylate synthase